MTTIDLVVLQKCQGSVNFLSHCFLSSRLFFYNAAEGMGLWRPKPCQSSLSQCRHVCMAPISCTCAHANRTYEKGSPIHWLLNKEEKEKEQKGKEAIARPPASLTGREFPLILSIGAAAPVECTSCASA